MTDGNVSVKLRGDEYFSILTETGVGVVREIIHLYKRTMAKKLSWKPRGDYVLVKPAEKAGEKKLASGIIIPESVDKEKLITGTVVAVGPGKRSEKGDRMPVDISAGATVAFKKPWDEPIKIDGEEYYVLAESDITLIQE